MFFRKFETRPFTEVEKRQILFCGPYDGTYYFMPNAEESFEAFRFYPLMIQAFQRLCAPYWTVNRLEAFWDGPYRRFWRQRPPPWGTLPVRLHRQITAQPEHPPVFLQTGLRDKNRGFTTDRLLTLTRGVDGVLLQLANPPPDAYSPESFRAYCYPQEPPFPADTAG